MTRKVKGVVHGSILRWHETSVERWIGASPMRREAHGKTTRFQFAWTPLWLKFGLFPTPKTVLVKMEGVRGGTYSVAIHSMSVGRRGGHFHFKTQKAAQKKYNTIKKMLMKAKTDGAVVGVIRGYMKQRSR